MIVRNILLSIVILSIGVVVSINLVKMKPKAAKKSQFNLATLVQYKNFKAQEEQMVVNGLGVVEAAQSITLTPQVTGVVTRVSEHLTVGSVVQKGETLLSIDAIDYQVAVQEAQARVEIAKQEVKLEQGRAQVAKKEWEIMRRRSKSKKIDDAAKDRALRAPQAAIAKAQLKVAQTALKRARVNLKRAKIKAPFNAMVVNETVDQGQLVGPNMSIARLVGTDSFWITTPIASDDLQWINIPTDRQSQGAEVKVIYDLGTRSVNYKGRVLRQLYEIESVGRMTRLLIEVPNPLSQENTPALPLGAQVRVEIEGKKVDQLYKVPRTAIRNETQLWLFDTALSNLTENNLLPSIAQKEQMIQGRLKVVHINVLRKLKDYVLIDQGLSSRNQIITSRIATPVPGMQVRALKDTTLLDE